MIRRLAPLAVALGLAVCVPAPSRAQGERGARAPDSIVVAGNRRVADQTVVQLSGLAPGRSHSYREVQRAIQVLFATGQYDDVRVEQDTANGRNVLVIRVHERPVLLKWTVRGVERLSERSVKEQVRLNEGHPLDPLALARARGRIDSLYRTNGHYLVQVRTLRVYEADSARVRVVFDVAEGRRVAVSQVDVQGNTKIPDGRIVGEMKSKPEAFWWFRSGEFDDEKLRTDLEERVPKFYGEHGFVDFQVLGDTLLVDDTTGKATLVVQVSEGDPYRVGTFEIAGNRRFSTEELETMYPFGRDAGTGLLGLGPREAAAFNQQRWDEATETVLALYRNNGYIYATVRPDVMRRTGPDGAPVVDLRWVINEGQPAIVNRIEIVGNEVTHERVIRDAIVLLPGDVYRQDALIRSYQNISNLGFFAQPLPPPDTRPANEQGDVDVVFHVAEKHTGNVNFGASLGQGTGVGGFLGLDEPNLFGKGKRGQFQWQFGKNINDFNLSYSDPTLRGSRISSTVGVHNTRLRYQIGDLGQMRRRGANLQLGFPVFNDRYTRLFVSYAIDRQSFIGSATNLSFLARFGCQDCLRSTLGVSMLRDTRIDLPFPTGGTMHQIGISQSGGPLGGKGNFQRIDLESRYHAPLGELGSSAGGARVKFALGFSTRSGFVFGNAPFFEQLFFLGGTQFGIPLRGYEEFAITPQGFDPRASGGRATGANSFGKAFFTMTGEVGMRVSQMFYLSTFFDAGNIWARPGEYNPSRLFRGAGIGLAMISPLGPLGLDYAYGFDRKDLNGRPDPGWKLHFKLGTFF